MKMHRRWLLLLIHFYELWQINQIKSVNILIYEVKIS